MAQNQHNDVALPENLKRQFATLERRLWKVETATAVGVVLIALVASYVVLFLSDRIWDSPSWWRTTVFLLGLATAVFAVLRWLSAWVLRRRDWRALSILVQRKYRRLGDRLLGIVELADQKEHPLNFSPELYRAAIQQVAEEAEKYDFPGAVETRSAKRILFATIGCAAFVLLLALLAPTASWNAMLRWGMPFSNTARFTLVSIQGLPDKLVVPHGENFQLRADVTYRSIWRPARAVAQITKQYGVESKVQQGKVEFQVPGQTDPKNVRIKIGDAVANLSIEPAHRPALKDMTARIELPDYLKYPPIEEKIQSGSLSLLTSSHVTFQGKVSRVLKSASLTDGKKSEPLTVTNNEFKSLPLPADDISQFLFTWQDTLGLSNAAPWKLAVQLQKDRPPAPDLPELPRDIAILQSDVLNIKAVAKDDYGVREVGLSWEFGSTAEEPQEWASTELKVNKNSTREKVIEEVFQWSPTVFRAAPDTSVEMIAFTTDFLPGRERTESSVHYIHILSNEKHAELVRQNLESVLARVEEVARLEEKVLAKADDLAADEKSKPNEMADKIGKAAEEQQQSAKSLNELSREGMKTLQEALKNPVFTEKALQDWAKTLKQMQELAEGKMKETGGDLQKAQQNAGDSQSSKQDLAKAQTKLEEILKELEQIQGKVNKGLDDLQALTLSERLRRVGEAEQQIGGELQKIIPDTIGMLSKELPQKFKRLEQNLAKGQQDMQSEAQVLQKEIHRFFERTQKANYGDVSKEMTDAKTGDELDRVRGLVSDNITMEATRNLTAWSKRFLDWADKLKPPTEESASNGGGQGSGAMNMTQTLIALLRLRLGEMNLHNETRLLEEKKATLPTYTDRAQVLFGNQQKITAGLSEIEKQNQSEALAVPYKEAREQLAGVESLLQKPQTDDVTMQAEKKSIDALTDLINLINEQAKRNSPQSGGQPQPGQGEDMAFLMQMAQQQGVGQGVAMQPGGSMSGGTTSRAANAVQGDATGKTGEQRQVNKASGAAGVSVPAEFRETLENYFKALEKETQ